MAVEGNNSHGEDESLLNRYVRFVRQNGPLLQAFESAAQLASWLVPDGEGSELALEAAGSTLGVLNSINARLLQPRSSGPAVAWSVLLAMLAQVEVLAEMAAQRAYGPEGKWPAVLAVEAVKAGARLALLRRRGLGSVLLDGGERSSSLSPEGPKARAKRALLGLLRLRRVVCGLPPTEGALRARRAIELRAFGGKAAVSAGELLHVLRPAREAFR